MASERVGIPGLVSSMVLEFVNAISGYAPKTAQSGDQTEAGD
ncbi:hypothetical protein [Limnoglobus roseus]|nr:hypothetical protein [Limnoglobus roseus]